MKDCYDEYDLPERREDILAARCHALLMDNFRMRQLLVEIIDELDEAIKALDDITECT